MLIIPENDKTRPDPFGIPLRNGNAVLAACKENKISIRNEEQSLHGILSSLIECLKQFMVVTEKGEISITYGFTSAELDRIKTQMEALLCKGPHK